MSDILPILQFELSRQLRRPSFWVVAALLFVFGFIDVLAHANEGNAYFYVNSPSAIFGTTIWYSFFGLLATTACVADTFIRDAEYKTEEIVLSTPISKRSYLAVRFLGAFAVALLAFSCYLPGMILANFAPGMSPFALGPLRMDAYIASHLFITAPNLFIASVVAFVIASRTRSLAMTYVGSIAMMMLYFAGLLLVGMDSIDYDQLTWWGLADPYGFYAIETQTLSWSIHQRNTEMLSLGGVLLWNRLIWLSIAIAAWGISYRTYQLRCRETDSTGLLSKWVSKKTPIISRTSAVENRVVVSCSSQPKHSFVMQLWHRTRFELCSILRAKTFLLLAGFGIVNAVLACLGRHTFNDTNPSTDILIHASNVSLEYILFAIVLVYTAELIWRDRILGVQSVVDATPLSNAVLMLSKLIAIISMIVVYLMLVMMTLLGCQHLLGHTDYELPLYLQMLFGEHAPYYVFTAALALFAQVVTRHKYAGMGMVLLATLSTIPLDALGLYHNLYRWSVTNNIDYSPMNGYGGLFVGHLWYCLYWGLFSAALLMVAYFFWDRGEVQPRNWQRTWRHVALPAKRFLAFIVIAWISVGGWIFYNTTILNRYQPPGKEETAAEVEKRFRQYEKLPMPVVVETKVNVEIYPKQRYFTAQGEYKLKNQTEQPIKELHLLMFLHCNLDEASCPGAVLRESHPEWGYSIYDLTESLLPGQTTTLKFTISTTKSIGFRNHVDSDDVYMIYPNDVVENGTNLYSPFFLPFIGYTKLVEHKKEWLRARQNLPPLNSRMLSHDDSVGLSKGLMLSHLTWGSTEVTVGTSGDQYAVCAGDLIKQSKRAGRNYFTYRLKDKNRGKFTLYSARYAQRRDDRARVPIEVYFHPQHANNIDFIVEELASILEFYEATFGPYPFDQIRLVECVYYDSMVFSEAGTLGIPEVLVWKSEAQGPGKDRIINWLSYLMAKAWWDDQLIAADVAGGMAVREMLSEYASGLYLQSRRTPAEQHQAQTRRMREYFRALGKADFREPSLDNVYNELLIARHKGAMTLDLIEDQIGRGALLSAIGKFFKQYRYSQPPYATIVDLQEMIVAAVPNDGNNKNRLATQKFIGELFTQRLSFDVKPVDAVVTPLPNGQYRVSANIEGHRLRASDSEAPESLPLNLPVTIVLQEKQGNELFRDRIHVVGAFKSNLKENNGGSSTHWEVIIKDRPEFIEVDPEMKLPSAFPQDNRVKLRFAIAPSSITAPTIDSPLEVPQPVAATLPASKE